MKDRFAGHNNQADDLFRQKVENDKLNFKANNSPVLNNGLDTVRNPKIPSHYIPITFTELSESIGVFLTVFNICPSRGVTTKIWKYAVVTMIQKGSKLATDPNNRYI